MAGWSVIASGRSLDADVIAKLREGLEVLEGHPGAGTDAVKVTTTDDGWTAEASGSDGDPIIHAQVLAHVKDLVSAPEAEAGSSEFNSPYVAVQNFHDVPPVVTVPDPPPADPAAGATG